MVKSALFRGDANQLMNAFQCCYFKHHPLTFFTIYWILDRSPGALSVLLNLARFDFCSIQNQINGKRKEIISHLCFKKELCLTGKNNMVKLPPTVLQIQDVGRWANYL